MSIVVPMKGLFTRPIVFYVLNVTVMDEAGQEVSGHEVVSHFIMIRMCQ